MKLKFFSIFVLILIFPSLFAVNVVFHNKTNNKIYIATCYYHKLKAIEVSAQKEILPRSDLLIELPEKKAGGYTRYALIFLRDAELKEKLRQESKNLSKYFVDRDQFKLSTKIQIGTGRGPDFFIEFDEKNKNILDVYDNSPNSQIKRQIKKTNEEFLANFKEPAVKPLRKKYVDLQKYPHANEVAKVRFSKDISSQEKEIVKRRLRKVAAKIENVLHKKVDADSVPKIALCCSGGGFRAMLATIAFLTEAKDLGLLDYICYMSALSGSSWAIGPWITSELSLEAYFRQMLLRIKEGMLAQKAVHVLQDWECLYKKSIFNQPITLIDLWGTILTHKLLYGFGSHENSNNISLDEQLKSVSSGDIPFPIYTAILTRKDPDYQWFEFTPCECGSDYLGGYVPTWALGRSFELGKALGHEPPQSLGYILGICGSAISVNFLEMWQKQFSNMNIFKPFAKAMEDFDTVEFGRIRLNPAKIWNYTVGVADLPRRNQLDLTLIDAGINFNLPLPPFWRQKADLRKADIIIILDASAGAQNSSKELKKAYKRANKDGVSLPPVKNFDDLNGKICSVLKDNKNPKAPVIIYMPMAKDPNYSLSFNLDEQVEKGFLSTFNFKYSDVRSTMEFVDMIKFNLEKSKDTILYEIKNVIDKKQRGANVIGGYRATEKSA
jgi:hypothetical protein